MDVLKPELLWIEGRCYRKNPVKVLQADVEEEEAYSTDYTTASDDIDESIIEKVEEGKYQTTIKIPAEFYKFIIGSKGATKKTIESETKTSVIVPRHGHSGDIVIVGHNKQGVASARTRIEVMVNSVRQKQPFTHFISLPFNWDIMKKAFLEFKDDVLLQCDGARGLEPTLFQNPDKLHITIGTLVLMDEHERKQAAEVLKECEEEIVHSIFQGSRVAIRVQGIEYMNDDPGEVDVLYAKVASIDGSNKVQELADRLVAKFVSTGLMQKQYERVKLHITLINTLFRTDKSGVIRETSTNKQSQRETFDARPVLEKFEDYHFADLAIPAIHLSQLHSTGPDGYYAASAKIDLPS